MTSGRSHLLNSISAFRRRLPWSMDFSVRWCPLQSSVRTIARGSSCITRCHRAVACLSSSIIASTHKNLRPCSIVREQGLLLAIKQISVDSVEWGLKSRCSTGQCGLRLWMVPRTRRLTARLIPSPRLGCSSRAELPRRRRVHCCHTKACWLQLRQALQRDRLVPTTCMSFPSRYVMWLATT